ncbi:MAG: TonB family protein [Cellvibrio sp.]|nr:TonB family protein [Cellvibrio sp.]
MNSSVITMNNIDSIDISHFVKKMLALCLAVVMTMMLFYMMYLLIKNDSIPDEPIKTPEIPSTLYKAPVPDPVPPEEQPLVKPVIQNPPPVTYEPLTPTAVAPSIPEPGLIGHRPPIGINPLAIDAQPMPMVRVSPAYPQSAVVRRIEGFVDVVFDVTETGAVENIQIVHAEPEKIFNSAVMKSVSRWKYRPKMEEGVAMKMYGLRERIRFNMEK